MVEELRGKLRALGWSEAELDYPTWKKGKRQRELDAYRSRVLSAISKFRDEGDSVSFREFAQAIRVSFSTLSLWKNKPRTTNRNNQPPLSLSEAEWISRIEQKIDALTPVVQATFDQQAQIKKLLDPIVGVLSTHNV